MRRNRDVAAFVLLLLGLGPPSAAAQATAEELYQSALYQEEVQGNLERAIDQFARIRVRFPESRAVGARAQLHIGLCYEKLGQREARQAFRRVIEDFPEHAAEVALARDRLAEIERAEAERNHQPTFRKVEIPSRPQNGVLSPSGDSLAFVSEGSLWVVPLSSSVGADVPGEPVVLAEEIDAWDVSNLLSWSADGKWIAVNSETPDPEGSIHVVPVDGGEARVVQRPPSGGHAYSYRLGLSPAGEAVAFTALEPGWTEGAEARVWERVVYVAPTRGGEPRQLTSTWGRTPAISPDGELAAFVGLRERDELPEGGTRATYDGDLWVVPSAGGAPVRLATVDGRLAGPVWSPEGRSIAARYESGGGNETTEIRVYRLSPDRSSATDPVTIELPRGSLDMIAGWTTDDELGVFMHSEAHDAIYTVPASGGRAVQVSPETEAPLYPRWSADGDRIYFRWMTGDDEAPVGVAHVRADGGGIVALTVPSPRRLVSRYPGPGFSLSPDGRRLLFSAYQEPYSPEEGVDLWVVSLEGGSPLRLTHDPSFEGYAAWTPDGEWVVFLDTVEDPGAGDGYAAVFRVRSDGGEPEQLTSRGDGVAPGPIAVSPDGERIAFTSEGDLRTMPAGGGPATVLVQDVQLGPYSDMAWSPDGARIAWNGGGRIWIAPGDGSGPPVALQTGLPENTRHGTFSWSPDGTRIAFRGVLGGEDELWLITDFLPGQTGR